MNVSTLNTDRLVIRPVTEDDLEQVFVLHAIPEVDHYNTFGIPKDVQEIAERMKPLFEAMEKEDVDYFTYMIDSKTDGTNIGMIAIFLGRPGYKTAEVWFKLMPNEWGKGYATEALECILDFAFNTLKLHRVEAGCAVENLGSIRVMEKVGMTREGRRRLSLPLKTGWMDNFEYAILASDR